MGYYLIADVGGTNIRLAIARVKEQDYFLLQTYRCNKFLSISDAIKHYLATIPTEFKPQFGAIAVAATILSDKVIMTNHNWNFSIQELSQDLNFKKLQVINDFEAQAYAVEYLKKEDYITIIQGENSNQIVNKRVITGPGSGLGTCFLLKQQDNWLRIASEAGHSSIAYSNDTERDIFDYYLKNQGMAPYAELFISGKGIVNIYKALAIKNHAKEVDHILPKTIYQKASDSNDKNSIYYKSLDIFCELLATYISNIALTYLPQQIYLTGGILPKIIRHFNNSDFKVRFSSSKIATIQRILSGVSVYLITKENPAMLGMAMFAINNKA